MKKLLFAFIVAVVIITGCEKDDICLTTPATPNLVLRLYDNNNTNTLKQVDSLYVWSDTRDSLYINQTTDSIVLPLNPNTNSTVYNLSKGTLLTGTLTINYTTEFDYLSRSCGYRIVYNQVNFSENNQWIERVVNQTTDINQQNAAHAHIFH